MPSINDLIQATCDVVFSLQEVVKELRSLNKKLDFAIGLGTNYLKVRAISVGTTPVKVSEAVGMPEGFKILLLFNNDIINANTIYIGDSSGVTVDTGFPLPPGQALPLTMQMDREIWAVASASGCDLRVIELK
jgi:hypothetical protein